MARLPGRDELSGPASLRSGRMISSADMSGIGRGISALGGSLEAIGQERAAQQNTVDVARAEAFKTERMLATENEFQNDGDYSTFQKRAPEKTKTIVDDAANLIRDPKMRERWGASARGDAARVNDRIFDRGETLRGQAEVNALDEALEANRRLYVDPTTPEDVKKKARSEIEGAIEVAGQAGLLTPDMQAARKKLYVDNADFNRGQLAVQQNPDAIGSPVKRTVAAAAQRYGVPPAIALGIVQIESGFDPSAKAGTSSAGGLYQFIDGTASRYGLANKFDVGSSADAGARLTRDNIDGLRRVTGREPSPGEIYLAHFSGFGVAQKLAQAADDTPTSAIFSPQAIAANRSILDGKTAGQVKAWADRKMATAMGAAQGSDPDWFKRLSPEDQFRLTKEADTVRTQRSVETRSAIEVVTANAPTAIMNTGRYDNALPTQEQFFQAYGPQEGAERFNNFQSAVETSAQAFEMRTMSAGDIEAMVADARPVRSGDTAELDQKRYETLSSAAAATLKARAADPVAYAQQAFPGVQQAWAAAETPEGYQSAIAASVAAQQQMGITDIKPLPKDFATLAVETFKDVNRPEAERLDAIGNVLMATPDNGQRKAIFEQMVEAGLPDMTEGAFVALSRGDTGAANRLFRAALVDPSKLPGKAPAKPDEIDGAVQSALMDENQIGDLYYGLSDGSAENLVRAQRDSKLLNNAVNLRLRNGEELSAAVSGAAKDLYGDVKPVSGGKAQILLPMKEDEAPYIEGFEGLMPQVEEAINSVMVTPPDLPTADSTKAIMSAVKTYGIQAILSEGHFRNHGDGFVFLEPFDGTAIPGPDGNPLVFTAEQVKAARSLAPAPLLPTDQDTTVNDNVQTEMQQQEDRVRQMYEGVQ